MLFLYANRSIHRVTASLTADAASATAVAAVVPIAIA
ncbi:unnamed protein product [Gemmata massiliana]|uniref:Uncharacterized protein n=1 Tax=Gemmata massiliana TaxID=1210884 RepID=A0A6P2D483_9BACT|nr:unnamed protein product [Gemmata massiliana]